MLRHRRLHEPEVIGHSDESEEEPVKRVAVEESGDEEEEEEELDEEVSTVKPVIYGNCFGRPPALYGHFMKSNLLCNSLDLITMFILPSFVRPPALYGRFSLKILLAVQSWFRTFTYVMK